MIILDFGRLWPIKVFYSSLFRFAADFFCSSFLLGSGLKKIFGVAVNTGPCAFSLRSELGNIGSLNTLGLSPLKGSCSVVQILSIGELAGNAGVYTPFFRLTLLKYAAVFRNGLFDKFNGSAAESSSSSVASSSPSIKIYFHSTQNSGMWSCIPRKRGALGLRGLRFTSRKDKASCSMT